MERDAVHTMATRARMGMLSLMNAKERMSLKRMEVTSMRPWGLAVRACDRGLRSKKHANTVTQGEAWCRGHDSAGLGFNGPNGSMGWQTETWL